MSDQPPIIVKKIKKGEGHHGGAWKVAYADFVTAMMALFIVLWVLGQSEQVKKAVEGYFKDPVGFGKASKNVLSGAGTVPKINESQPGELSEEAEKERLKKMGEKILTDLSTSPEFSNLADKVKVEVVEEGLRIEMLESSDNVFFEVGTSNLNNQAKSLLIKIGNELSKIPNKIIVEGHTDSRPLNNGTFTNFELSANRANAARYALSLSEMKESQLDEVRGYADRRLRDKEDPYNLVNRRISIIVKYGSKK